MNKGMEEKRNNDSDMPGSDAEYEERRRRRLARRQEMLRRQRRKKTDCIRNSGSAAGFASRIGISQTVKLSGERKAKEANPQNEQQSAQASGKGDAVKSGEDAEEDKKGEDKAGKSGDDVLAQADLLAAQYDYDKAIALLKETKGYDSNEEYQKAVAGYEETKATCVSWPLEEVTHVFYHTLIKDPAKAFDGDYKGGRLQSGNDDH